MKHRNGRYKLAVVLDSMIMKTDKPDKLYITACSIR